MLPRRWTRRAFSDWQPPIFGFISVSNYCISTLFYVTVYSDTFLLSFCLWVKSNTFSHGNFFTSGEVLKAWNYMVDSAKLRNFSKVFPAGQPCENWVRVHVFGTACDPVVRSWCDEWRITPKCEGESREGVPMVWYVSFVSGVGPDPENCSLAWVLAEDVFMLDVLWITVMRCIIIIIIIIIITSGRKEGPPSF